MKWLVVAAILPLVFLSPAALLADPDDGVSEKLKLVEELMRRIEEAKAESGPEVTFEGGNDTVLKVYNVSDLTVRLNSYIPPNLRLRPAGAEIDESAPLFGRSSEGEILFGGVEDVLDLITMNVRPDDWDGDDIRIGVSGNDALVVVAEPEVHREISDYLRLLRRSAGKMVTVEIRVLRAEAGSRTPLPSGSQAMSLSRESGLAILERAEAGQGCRIVHSARITGYNGQRVGLHRGRQRAFVQDYDVEVAEDSMISDPIVGVCQTGLAFDVIPVPRGDKLVILDLRATVAALVEEMRLFETPSGPVQAPAISYIEFASTVTIADGGFGMIGAGSAPGRGRWALLVTAHAERIVSPESGGVK